MSKQVIEQDNKQDEWMAVADAGQKTRMSTIESIREQILSIPEDEDFAIIVPIGGDPNACE